MSEHENNKIEAHLQTLADHGTPVSWTPEKRIHALITLINALESGMKLVQANRAGDPEPYPGALDGVIRVSISSVAAGRKAGLLP